MHKRSTVGGGSAAAARSGMLRTYPQVSDSHGERVLARVLLRKSLFP